MDNVCQLLWEAVLVAGSYCKEVAEMTSIVLCLLGPEMAKKQFREQEALEHIKFRLGNVETEKNLKKLKPNSPPRPDILWTD